MAQVQSYVTTARMQAGKLKVRNRQALKRTLATWKDGEYIVRIERAHATRSLQANAFYWGVVVELLAEHTGYTPDEIHEVLKAKFLPKRLAVCDGNGEIRDELVIGGTTTTLDNVEFSDYISRIRQWAVEDLGVVIPDPDPNWRDNEHAA